MLAIDKSGTNQVSPNIPGSLALLLTVGLGQRINMSQDACKHIPVPEACHVAALSITAPGLDAGFLLAGGLPKRLLLTRDWGLILILLHIRIPPNELRASSLRVSTLPKAVTFQFPRLHLSPIVALQGSGVAVWTTLIIVLTHEKYGHWPEYSTVLRHVDADHLYCTKFQVTIAIAPFGMSNIDSTEHAKQANESQITLPLRQVREPTVPSLPQTHTDSETLSTIPSQQTGP
ncbi:hypothetical protein P152DRAFT_323906 [Eremomyces bilateralis CBS 781.70]|uniref:Uncharacterized protein n=1 Tax=Eremomyces bilateralis CBS 781.70 TaxID=1392243 RepID=A0A6G1G6G8_9PEZI|nr:uncharacterized protein P152DRAFT_323906 [Eremomyces bilateralis CBS 781.70]KAF1813551.1 hypothetical protein P152DRAFT_323906 [Eremomyces bilateralis CBS 781.70]